MFSPFFTKIFSLRTSLNVSLCRNQLVLMSSTSSHEKSPFLVDHDVKNRCFCLKDSTSKTNIGLLEYSKTKTGSLDLYHTEVDPKYQGQGLAKLLAKAAFDHAVSSQSKMILTCTYLQKYYRENPLDDYQKLVI